MIHLWLTIVIYFVGTKLLPKIIELWLHHWIFGRCNTKGGNFSIITSWSCLLIWNGLEVLASSWHVFITSSEKIFCHNLLKVVYQCKIEVLWSTHFYEKYWAQTKKQDFLFTSNWTDSAIDDNVLTSLTFEPFCLKIFLWLVIIDKRFLLWVWIVILQWIEN